MYFLFLLEEIQLFVLIQTHVHVVCWLGKENGKPIILEP